MIQRIDRSCLRSYSSRLRIGSRNMRSVSCLLRLWGCHWRGWWLILRGTILMPVCSEFEFSFFSLSPFTRRCRFGRSIGGAAHCFTFYLSLLFCSQDQSPPWLRIHDLYQYSIKIADYIYLDDLTTVTSRATHSRISESIQRQWISRLGGDVKQELIENE